jgi:hypothetical protein
MNEELQVLQLVTQRLEEAGIAYMVTGSVAMSFYAMPRMTRDIDIVIAIRETDIPRMVSLFKDDFYIDRDMVIEAVREEDMFNIIHNEYVLKIDFIVRKSDEYRQVEFARRCKVRIDSISIWLVSPEDLVLSKLWWAKDSHSEQQLSDVKNIMRHVRDLDRKYIKEWVQRLDLSEIYGGLEHE